ncbi:hypothetical protein LAZ67_14001991 [Cordylochernes scorpioides]|uniref:Uncharacterized protein n=1 Tax=Cordylochernes scorpioides TaxID=51811 RepID=A0ABY6L7L6_9ARAC|nr:hypothetical protein LAZ67_14001991 [Cordylochernes scorpioides]
MPPRQPLSSRYTKSVDVKSKFQKARFKLPLSLAFSMTINKAQSQTFARVSLLLQVPLFTHGQLHGKPTSELEAVGVEWQGVQSGKSARDSKDKLGVLHEPAEAERSQNGGHEGRREMTTDLELSGPRPKISTAKPLLKEPVFTHEQLYVAFSSVPTLDSIHVKLNPRICKM